jgi:hypothetical protein
MTVGRRDRSRASTLSLQSPTGDGFVATFSDISERLRAEEAMRRSELTSALWRTSRMTGSTFAAFEGRMIWASPSC